MTFKKLKNQQHIIFKRTVDRLKKYFNRFLNQSKC